MKDRYHKAIDGMRVTAILAVVGIHATTKALSLSGFDTQTYIFSFFFNQILRFAVPVFFLISGFVLEINYPFHQSYRSYLKKRLSRILIPYLFWTLFYCLIVYPTHLPSFFIDIFTGEASYQLYFIPTLLLFYIIFPFLHKHYKALINTSVVIFLGIVQLVLLLVDYYVTSLSLPEPLRIFFLNYYVFLLGMFAAHHHQKIYTFILRHKKKTLALCAFLAFVVFGEGLSFYLKTQNYQYFYSQWRPSVLLYSVVISGVLYTFFQVKQKYYATLKTFSRLSLFVFFVHVSILELLWNLFGRTFFDMTQSTVPYLFSPVFFLLIAAISYIIAFCVHKIPYAAKLMG